MTENPGPYRLIQVSQAGVAVHLVVTVIALTAERSGRSGLLAATTALHFGFFVVGALALLTGFVIGIGRSREELVGVGALFFLSEAGVSKSHRSWIYGLISAQVLIGVTGSFLAPLTPVAFSSLAPAFGFGIMALYGGLYSTFRPKESASSIEW